MYNLQAPNLSKCLLNVVLVTYIMARILGALPTCTHNSNIRPLVLRELIDLEPSFAKHLVTPNILTLRCGK